MTLALREIVILAAVGVMLGGCQSKVEEAVKKALIDGDSAKFEDVKQCSGDKSVYVGKVNAKNRMGAYVGFEPFFYDGSAVSFVANDNFSELMDRCYSEQSPSLRKDGGDSKLKVDIDWSTSEDINPVDDSKTVRATLSADDSASTLNEHVTLTIRCQSNKTELYVNWNDYLGDDSRDVYDEWKRVTVRIGENKAQQQRWGISTDSKATFAPNSPVNLIKEMAKVDRLVLQTTPYNENPVTAVFNLKGIKEAVSPIAKECGWAL
ncbi:MAG: hypothetical protein EP345_17565 [Sphingomonadales bacterium]|nr:MAG: hypothetical protein EP345_17565 [Sphingomonadales bacterium]